MAIPTRFVDDGSARAIHGDRVDRLAPYLLLTDPPADAAVAAFEDLPAGAGFAQLEAALAGKHGASHPAIAALVEACERVPPWVDFDVIDGAGALLLRAGLFGGLILALQSLPYGYASPGGNKPLAFSGRLVEQAPRRLAETSRFVHAVCQPGGLRRHADGFAICVKVRVMHARVRRLLWRSGRWNAAAWGEPINQHDMAATSLLFSVAVLDGMRKVGFHVGDGEANRYMQLWRYAAWLLGTDLELLSATEDEGRRLADLIKRTQGKPDDDSRALTAALFRPSHGGKTRVHVAHALARHLLGDELADGLGIPTSPLSPFVPVLRRTLGALDTARAHVGSLDALAVTWGAKHWSAVIAQGKAHTTDFHPPGALRAA